LKPARPLVLVRCAFHAICSDIKGAFYRLFRRTKEFVRVRYCHRNWHYRGRDGRCFATGR